MGAALVPLIGAGATLLGGILGHKGKNREIKQQNQLTEAEYARRDAEQQKRASGRAAFMMSLLKAYGYEGAINEDQARAMLTHSQDRPVAGAPESGLSLVGRGLGQAGTAIIAAGSNKNSDGEGSSSSGGGDFWDKLFEEIARKPSASALPPLGSGAGGGGSAAMPGQAAAGAAAPGGWRP